MATRAKTPRPGQPVRGSRTGRPINVLLDLLGRRWALRVLWELRSEPATFRELRDRCDGLSPTVLSTRIEELRDSGIITVEPYDLTPSGRELVETLTALDRWAKNARWSHG